MGRVGWSPQGPSTTIQNSIFPLTNPGPPKTWGWGLLTVVPGYLALQMLLSWLCDLEVLVASMDMHYDIHFLPGRVSASHSILLDQGQAGAMGMAALS